MPVIQDSADWICLDKPAGPGVRAYPWDPGVLDIDTALNQQLQDGKPELLRLNAEMFGSVYYMEPEVSGVALFAKNRESLAALRNQFGSAEFEFRFLFVAPTFVGELEEGFQADAPLLPHFDKPKMIPSTAKGKKASTLFQRLSTSTLGWSLWQATTRYPRPHQVRAHFALSESAILGDETYGESVAPTLKDMMPKKRGPGMSAPVFSGMALHLSAVRVPVVGSDSGEMTELAADLPKAFQVMLKRMQLDGSV